MRLVGHGHGAIRATHAKTLELTADATITERATCVIAVGAQPDPPRPLAGPVRVTITAGDETFAFDARANPTWDPAGPAVIRRSALRRPGTLATEAGAAAADLPRALVAALQAPGTRVQVRLEPRPEPGRVVLFAADPARMADPALTAELAVADRVQAEDAGARALLAARAPTPATPAAGDAADDDPADDDPADDDAAADGPHHRRQHPPLPASDERLLLVATADLPGASLAGPDPRPDVPVETVGLPARLAVAAACPSRAPVLFAPDGSDLRGLLRATPAAHRLVVAVPHAELGRLLELAAAERGTGAATLAQEYGPVMRAAPGAVPDLPSRDTVLCCLHPAVPAAGAPALDPHARAAVLALLDDGVATRTAARALAQLTGWPRRQAYAAVLTLQPDRPR